MTFDARTVRGARIEFETSGSGPDVIWGHGLSQSRDLEARLPLIDWSRVPARVTRYDARGHGESETTPDLDGYRWSALADDQLELATQLGIRSYIAAGASMGCGTALHAAIRAPERVAKLILVLPPTALETRAAQASMWEQTARILDARGVEGLLAAQAANPAPIPDSIPDADAYAAADADALRSWDPARLATVMRGAGRADFPSRDAIAGIDVPTLLLDWTGDPVHPTRTADELHELLPHAQRHTSSSPTDLAAWTEIVARFIAR